MKWNTDIGRYIGKKERDRERNIERRKHGEIMEKKREKYIGTNVQKYIYN